MINHFVPYPPHGGCLQRSFNLLREVSKNNTIHLLTLNQKAMLPDEKSIKASIKALNEHCDTIKVFGIPLDLSRIKWYVCLFLNLFTLTPFTVWWFRSREFADEIEKHIQSNSFDLITFDTIDLFQYAQLAPNIPKVLNHHNVESTLLLRRSANEKNPFIKFYLYLQGRKLRRYEKKVVGKVDVNLTVSENDSDILRELVPHSRYEVVPNGTDIDYFKPDSNKQCSKRLVFTGGMAWYPNKDAMIYFCSSIYPLIKREIPDIEIDIIGRSPTQEIKKMAENDPSIKLHGYVDDVRGYINQAAAYVVPIRVGGGTRLKILDAFACGKALVSASVGCEGIDVTPEENILIGDSPEEFARQVIRILNDNTLREKLEINARVLVENQYSWKIIGHHLDEIYQSVAK